MSETKPASKVRRVPEKEPFAPGHRACIGCGEVVALRLAAKGFPDNTIVTMATGCMEVVSSQYPHTSWRVPWIHTLFENAASTASGIEAGLKAMIRKGRRDDIGTKVVAMAGDGGTSDIGLQALSGALERGHDLLYICLDNEAYMNTGIQRSSATPPGAWTTTTPQGKPLPKKNIMEIVTAHRIPYAATVSVAFPEDLRIKVEKAREVRGAKFLHVLSPCPPGWKSLSSETVKLGRLAVDTKIAPLYEVEDGLRWRITYEPRGLPVEDFLSRQGRFSRLGPESIRRIQAEVDRNWAVLKRQAEVNPL